MFILLVTPIFGHKNICQGQSDWKDKETACRPFNTIEEHDEYLINEINRLVKPTDILWHLGDFGLGFAWKDRLPEIRTKIKCQTIYLVFGNHDGVIENSIGKIFPDDTEKAIKACFNWTGYLKFGKISGRSMVLCHYAMLTWPWQHHDSIHCFGHSHSNLKLPKEIENSKMIDVGVDTKHYGHKQYSPYLAEEIFHIMDVYKVKTSLDHHQPDRHQKKVIENGNNS